VGAGVAGPEGVAGEAAAFLESREVDEIQRALDALDKASEQLAPAV